MKLSIIINCTNFEKGFASLLDNAKKVHGISNPEIELFFSEPKEIESIQKRYPGMSVNAITHVENSADLTKTISQCKSGTVLLKLDNTKSDVAYPIKPDGKRMVFSRNSEGNINMIMAPKALFEELAISQNSIQPPYHEFKAICSSLGADIIETASIRKKDNARLACIRQIRTKLSFYLSPLKELRNSDRKQHKIKLYRTGFFLLLLVSFFLLPFAALDSGISGDEFIQYRQAEKTLDYYLSFGKDTSALHTPKGGLDYLFGSSFDVMTVAVNRLLGADNIFVARHIMNALVGWLTLLFLGMTLRYLLNFRAAFWGMFLLLVSPLFIGHSFNNPKDIPFAAFYLGAIYFFIRFLGHFPSINKRYLILTALMTGLAISTRVGGLILLFFFGFIFFLSLFKTERKSRKKLFIAGVVLILLSYTVGVLFWPYALQNPFSNPKDALMLMSKYIVHLRFLFNGELLWSDQLPWFYIPFLILITSPLAVFLLLPTGLLYSIRKAIKSDYRWILLLIATFLPIVFVIIMQSSLYNSWRHLLFSYPPLIILSVSGFEFVNNSIRKRGLKLILPILILLLSISPVLHMIRNHPNEYIYYNEIAGGNNVAGTEYESDYYFNSYRQACDWILNKTNHADTIVVASNFDCSAYFSGRPIKFIYSRFHERGSKFWDYFIVNSAYVLPSQIKSDLWPYKSSVFNIYHDDIVLTSVLERNDTSDYCGYKNLQSGNNRKAVQSFVEALKCDPENEFALFYLAQALEKMNLIDLSDRFLSLYIHFYPDNSLAYNSKGVLLLKKNDIQNAEQFFVKASEMDKRLPEAKFNLALIYYQKKDYETALEFIEECIQSDSMYQTAYYAKMDLCRILNDKKGYEEAQRMLKRFPSNHKRK